MLFKMSDCVFFFFFLHITYSSSAWASGHSYLGHWSLLGVTFANRFSSLFFSLSVFFFFEFFVQTKLRQLCEVDFCWAKVFYTLITLIIRSFHHLDVRLATTSVSLNAFECRYEPLFTFTSQLMSHFVHKVVAKA